MFRLIVVSPPEALPREHTWLNQLFEAGLSTLHLRKPGAARADVEDYLRAVPTEFHSRIRLHQHHELVEEYGLQGVHLPAAMRATWAGRLSVRQRLSTSFHSLAEVAQAQGGPFDYGFLSPVFTSISKAGYPAAFEPEQLTQALQAWAQRGRRVPEVVALGGISTTTIGQARQLGFAGAAVLGAVWQAPDPLLAFRELRQAAARAG
jgi:thiamine-phosphate pyrophosphorylase